VYGKDDPQSVAALTQEILQLSQTVENLGYDSLWVGDSLIRLGRLESVTLLSSIATITHRLRLGTCAMSSFALRDPILLAIQWATLDQISNGRSILGLALGGRYGDDPGWDSEWRLYERLYGRSPKIRTTLLEEGIEILRLVWERNVSYPRSFKGKFYNFELEGPVYPQPHQASVPIWIASNPHRSFYSSVEKFQEAIEKGLRRVARLADGWITQSIFYTPEEFQELRDRLNEYAHEQKRLVKSCYFYQVAMPADISEYEKVSREAEESLRRFGYIRSKEDAQRETVVGDADTQIKYLQRVVEAGADHVIFRFRLRDQYGQLHRFTREVMPSFR